MKKIIAFFKAADKQLHILACYAIALSVFIPFAAYGHYWWGFALGTLAALVAGGLKEWYDYKHPDTHDFEVADIVADVLGTVAAVCVMLFYCLKICQV
jgi:VanZ family protein